MTRTWCPKCKQSYFEPGKTLRVYVCVDGTIHPDQHEPITPISKPLGLVLKKMR